MVARQVQSGAIIHRRGPAYGIDLAGNAAIDMGLDRIEDEITAFERLIFLYQMEDLPRE
jgi:hypothetical protein